MNKSSPQKTISPEKNYRSASKPKLLPVDSKQSLLTSANTSPLETMQSVVSPKKTYGQNVALTTASKHDPKSKRKHEKIAIIAKNKKHQNQEKKVLELIHNNNPNKEDEELIYNIIDNHFFLQTLNDQARNEIIVTMSLCKIKEGQTLFTQGSVGNYWYIVHEGVLEVYVDGVLRETYKRGDSFGEHTLMNDAPRFGTVKTVTECQVWVLKKEVFKKILEYLSKLNYDENSKFLETVNLPLDTTFKSILANHLIEEIHKEGEYICKEGDPGNCMFIIKSGEVDCSKNGNVIRTLKKGDNFGQRALLQGDKRTMDVIAKTECRLYSISTEFFKSQFGPDFRQNLYYSFIGIAFQNSETFKNINMKMLNKTYSLFEFKNYDLNEVIFKAGKNMSDTMCIVLEGSIKDKKTEKIHAKRYEFLFGKELFSNEENILNGDLIAYPDCLIAIANYTEFKNLLGGDLAHIQKKIAEVSTFDNIAMFKNLSEDKLEILQSKIKIEKFEGGKKIINQGETGDKFYIIKQGRVDFFVNFKYVRSLEDGENFGARSLIISEKRSATAIANGPVTCYTLTAAVFKSILEGNLKDYFIKKIYLEDNTIELKDLDNIKELGKGNFGFVNLVRSKKNKQFYAIKALNTTQIKKENLESCVELERDVLLKVDHPFIMKMVKYLKNENYIFYLMEYIKGKELWEVIRDIGLLNKEQTQFYGGSMILAIDYLHKKKIIYRDIKPENIMVTDIGYIKIIDFGTVKEIKDRTSTIIGTSHYMAPEVVKGAGYSFQVDIWSIAICMYEFFCGKLPFGEDLDDPMDVYKSVSKDDLTFPTFVTDELFKDLMNKMLKKSPTSRLWKLKQIKEEPYFQGFEWNKLISLAIDPPYKIKLKEEKEDVNQAIPYISYLKLQDKGRKKNRNPSSRQLEFDKWLKNF